ncbi:hypothetical protein SELMODRAFT_112694 [Selaginella moellendorffii]|uniref:Pentacotripeptide-repeat region of PRORP domain-containing protein n=1 Tax=Selaginella moellendorffii TaxID=88036 RepID=D8SAV3_SELML|nr:hypothetical protein SELMODRAFT_112694 [Selaginella moellendorffii]
MAVHREAVTKLEASEWDAYVTSSLIDAYAKCGSLADSSKVFSSNTGQLRNVVSWNVLILGFAENGDARRALRLFHRMRREGCRPNASTNVAVLKACSNSIPSTAGKKFFHEMPSRYGIVPEVEHFHCVVDLLSRANQRVQGMTKRWNFEANEVTWTTIAGTRGVESRSGDATLVTKQEWAS